MIPHVVSFSGGRSSAYMLIQLLARGYQVDAIVFANTGKEKEATLLFVEQVQEYIGRPITWVQYCDNEAGYTVVDYETASRKGEPFEAMIKKYGYLPNVVRRICTAYLKVRCQKHLLMNSGWGNWVAYLGIRHDEPLRWGKIMQNTQRERWTNELPMVWWETNVARVRDFWRNMPFDLQLQPHEGNCDLCYLKGKKKKLQIIRDNPEIPKWWAEQEKLTDSTFLKDMSVEQLIQQASQPLLFDEYDMDYPCFCNAD